MSEATAYMQQIVKCANRAAKSRLGENWPWLKHYPTCVPPNLEYPEIAAWGFLVRSANAHPERIACRHANVSISYRDLAGASLRFAHLLAQLDVKPGDRVGIYLPNTPEFLIALHGIWMAGAVAVPISPLMVPEEISGVLQTTGCDVIVGLDLLLPPIIQGASPPRHIISTTIRDRLPYWKRMLYSAALWKKSLAVPRHRVIRYSLAGELAKTDSMFEPISPERLEDPAFILATGGTTGQPKAVVLSHRNLVANAHQLHHWAGRSTTPESILAIVPFFHCFGLTSCVMTGMAMAATVIMHHRFVPDLVIKLIDRYQPSVFSAVPTMLVTLNERLKSHPLKRRGLRFCISGGAPLDPDVAAEFARHTGATVVEGFGLSEAAPVTHVGPLDGSSRSGTIGLPLPDTEARIVDPETGETILADGEVGELVIRGPQVMSGYWQNPVATASAIRNGWLFTGDLATCDQDGFFRIVDRKKDLIITSGFKVYPSDVETVLRRCENVADIAIVGVADPERGEIVKAYVVPARGRPFDRSEFLRFARTHLSKHKVPRIVDFVDALPRTFLGKVSRRALRDQNAS